MKHTEKNTKRKRNNFWVKFSVICAIIFFFLAAIKMNIDINNLKSNAQKKQKEIEKMQLENEKMQLEIESFELNEETIKKIAKEVLNLLEEDAIIFKNSQPH